MSNSPILVTGAAGKVGAVGRTIVELLPRADRQQSTINLECLIGQRFRVRTPLSVAVRSSEREVGPIGTTLIHGTGERRPRQQLRPVLAQLGERRCDLMYPVSIE